MASPVQNIDEVGKAFVTHYYTAFDSDRSKLTTLYQNASRLHFEGREFVGPKEISEKLQNLPFQKVAHSIKSMDCQPSGCGGIIVHIVGELKVDDEANTLKFSQVFHLMPSDSSFWVVNDMFRLNYG